MFSSTELIKSREPSLRRLDSSFRGIKSSLVQGESSFHPVKSNIHIRESSFGLRRESSLENGESGSDEYSSYPSVDSDREEDRGFQVEPPYEISFLMVEFHEIKLAKHLFFRKGLIMRF